MRTVKDRIRHTFLFEAIALGIVSVGGSWITGHSLEAMGVLSLMFSLLAMSWKLHFQLAPSMSGTCSTATWPHAAQESEQCMLSCSKRC